MSASQMVTITCDSCEAVADCAEWTAKVTRHFAREAGWLVGLPGGRDICPDCRKAGKR